MSVIRLDNVKKKYKVGEDEFYALKGVNMAVEKNEFVAIMGPSGSGKSTMLHIVGCLDLPTEGKYYLDDVDVTKLNDDELSMIRNQKIGFVFQSFNLLPKFSVLENVMIPFFYSHIKNGKREQLAQEALERVGLKDKMKNMPNQISGGQRQRVAIARSLIMNPSIILADEPTGNLDTKTGEQVMKIFDMIHEEGGTVILITHEEDIAEHAERIIRLKDGVIESEQCEKHILSDKLR